MSGDNWVDRSAAESKDTVLVASDSKCATCRFINARAICRKSRQTLSPDKRRVVSCNGYEREQPAGRHE